MFDVYGLVSDHVSERISEGLFSIPDGSVLDSGSKFGGSYNDSVTIGTTTVTLTDHSYCIIRLSDDDLSLRPDKFAATLLAPAVRGVSDNFAEKVEDAAVVAVRACRIPRQSSSIYGGDYLSINGVDLRWFIDYDYSYLSERLVVDTFFGTASEIGAAK